MNCAKRTKLLAVIMLATLAVAGITVLSVADDSNNSDAATDNLTYYSIGDCLHISGTGAMKNYTTTSNLQSIYYNFTSCVIESGVTSIGDYAFFGCTVMTSVTISDSVILIGGSAFKNCYNLTSITFEGSQPTLTSQSFDLDGGSSGHPAHPTIYTTGWGSSSVFISGIIGTYTTPTYSLLTKNVTFQPNNGDNTSVVVVSPGSVISNWPSDPVKTGYVFTGWYSNSSLTILFEISTLITADIILYAGYEVSLVFQTEPSAVANVTASVSFDNAISCSAASSTNYNSVVWDFGDGSTSTAIYCIHMYGEPGTYTVTLTAVNDYASDSTSQDIAVHTVGSNVDGTTTGSEPSFLGIVWYVWAIIAAIVAVIVLAKMGVMPL